VKDALHLILARLERVGARSVREQSAEKARHPNVLLPFLLGAGRARRGGEVKKKKKACRRAFVKLKGGDQLEKGRKGHIIADGRGAERGLALKQGTMVVK